MFPKNVFPDTTAVNEQGHLTIGGCDVTRLGSCYVLDEVTIRNRCRSFRWEFGSRCPGAQVLYASKAYINPVLAALFASEGLGLDVVSGGELAVAVAVGFPMEKVYFHGNNKTSDELEYAVSQDIGRVVVDSFYELELLNDIVGRHNDGLMFLDVADKRSDKQDILIRVSPGIDPHTHAYTTTGVIDSKFGFSIQTGDATSAVRKALELPNLNLVGLHFHLGSPIFELEPYAAATDLVLRFAASLRSEGLDLQEFSPGGGFAIAYTRDQQPPSIADYAETIVSTLKGTCAKLGMPIPKLLVEPGRSIIGPAGVALYHIGAIKDIPGIRKYVSVDGGMGDNIRPALYQANYEVVSANKINRHPSQKVTIAGKYCESGDVLASDVMLPYPESGDVIAIPAAGAYCLSMSSNYNLNPRPSVVLVEDGRSRLIRQQESYQDMLRCDVSIEDFLEEDNFSFTMQQHSLEEEAEAQESSIQQSLEEEEEHFDTVPISLVSLSDDEEWDSEENRWIGF